VVGVDLNATCARAVRGPAQVVPGSLALDGAHEDLPLVLGLDGRQVQVGRAGSSLCRQAPHLVCQDFLAALGERREWRAGRHRLDPLKASAVVLERLQAACAGSAGLVLVLPAYLRAEQAALLSQLAEKAKLPLLGSVRAPLALALAAYRAEPWSGVSLVVNADDHAFSTALIAADGEQLWVMTAQVWPLLNLRNWKERLLNVVAERCIRHSRRDPRDSAAADQSLFDQIEDGLDRWEQLRAVDLAVQTSTWYQNLTVRPEEAVTFCERLVKQVQESIQSMLAASSARDMLQRVIVSRAVGRLPGMAAAMQSFALPMAPLSEREPSSDFGEDLLQPSGEAARVSMLGADAAARAAHALAPRFLQGELPRGYLDIALPLGQVASQPAGANPNKRNLRVISPEQ
jgi:hypothetical protein